MQSFALVGQIVLVAAIIVVIILLGGTRRLGLRWTLILSILLTPIGGLLFALISGPRRREPKRKSRTKRG